MMRARGDAIERQAEVDVLTSEVSDDAAHD
jgi:hypothetical protein